MQQNPYDDQRAPGHHQGAAAPATVATVSPRACRGCGTVPPAWNRRAVAELAIDWLVPDPRRPGQATAVAYCPTCAPAGGRPVAELACAHCGEGPLVIGITDVDAGLPPAVLHWLSTRGWTLTCTAASTTVVCPTCSRPTRHRPSSPTTTAGQPAGDSTRPPQPDRPRRDEPQRVGRSVGRPVGRPVGRCAAPRSAGRAIG